MKKGLLITVFGLLVAGGGAFFVAGMAGVPKHPEEKVKRGTDAYYTQGPFDFDLKDDFNVNVKGSEKYLRIGLGGRYKLGDEAVKGQPTPGAAGESMFKKENMALRSALTLLLSNKTMADLDGTEKKALLEHEILEKVNVVVFPEKDGRVEKIFIKSIIMQ